MISSDLPSLGFKLLQPVHFVVKELLDGVSVNTFKLLKDAKDHVKAALSLVCLLKHTLKRVHADLAVFVLSLAIG